MVTRSKRMPWCSRVTVTISVMRRSCGLSGGPAMPSCSISTPYRPSSTRRARHSSASTVRPRAHRRSGRKVLPWPASSGRVALAGRRGSRSRTSRRDSGSGLRDEEAIRLKGEQAGGTALLRSHRRQTVIAALDGLVSFDRPFRPTNWSPPSTLRRLTGRSTRSPGDVGESAVPARRLLG
jgi:hypothetical protein